MELPLATAINLGGKVLDAGGNAITAANSLGNSEQTQTTQTPSFNPEQEKNITQAQQTTKEAIQSGANAAKQIGVSTSEAMAPYTNEQQKALTGGENNPTQALQDTFNSIRENREFTENVLNNAEYSLANTAKMAAINPQGIFANMSGGQSLLASIGLVLGGVGAGLGGGPNLALKLLEANRDQAIAIQQKTFENNLIAAQSKAKLATTAASVNQTQATSSQMATASVNAIMSAAALGAATKTQQMTAKSNGELVAAQFQKDLLPAMANSANLFRSMTANGDRVYTTHLGEAIFNALGSLYTGSKPLKLQHTSYGGSPIAGISAPVPEQIQSATRATNSEAPKPEVNVNPTPPPPNPTNKGELSDYTKYGELMNSLNSNQNNNKSKLNRESLIDFLSKK